MTVKELTVALQDKADQDSDVMVWRKEFGHKDILIVQSKKEFGGVLLGAHVERVVPTTKPSSLLDSSPAE